MVQCFRLWPKRFTSIVARVRYCRVVVVGGVYSIFMHGRSMAIATISRPTMRGRSMSGFHRPDRYCLTKREAP